MSYNSTIENYPLVKKDKIRLLRAKFEKALKVYEKCESELEKGQYDWVSRFLEETSIDAEGVIQFGNNIDGTHYDQYDFFPRFIAPYVEAGKLEFLGEDGARWGFEFDGQGNVFRLEYRSSRGLPIDPYPEAMRRKEAEISLKHERPKEKPKMFIQCGEMSDEGPQCKNRAVWKKNWLRFCELHKDRNENYEISGVLTKIE